MGIGEHIFYLLCYLDWDSRHCFSISLSELDRSVDRIRQCIVLLFHMAHEQ